MDDFDSIKSSNPDDRQFRTGEDPSQILASVRSESFQNVLRIARQVARFDSSLLITGETGVGKEVVARYIHSLSSRSARALLSVNCGALPETLLESELFGHKVGSFTGAVKDRVGLFEQAARGTILLDEIGDVSLATQVKLLRVLQEREILRIGESIPRKVDARIIAATNRNLDKIVREGKFRQDLLYRLRVIEIEVPPLRERYEDILSLADYYVKELAGRLKIPDLRIESECFEYFRTYSWPGNVRELQNAIERAAVLGDGSLIKAKNLPPQILNQGSIVYYDQIPASRTLRDVEMDYILAVLRSTHGNRSKAARILGIGPATLWRKLKNVDKK